MTKWWIHVAAAAVAACVLADAGRAFKLPFKSPGQAKAVAAPQTVAPQTGAAPNSIPPLQTQMWQLASFPVAFFERLPQCPRVPLRKPDGTSLPEPSVGPMVAWLQVYNQLVCDCSKGYPELVDSRSQDERKVLQGQRPYDGMVYEIGSLAAEDPVFFQKLATHTTFSEEGRLYQYWRRLYALHRTAFDNGNRREIMYTRGLRVSEGGKPIPFTAQQVAAYTPADKRPKFTEDAQPQADKLSLASLLASKSQYLPTPYTSGPPSALWQGYSEVADFSGKPKPPRRIGLLEPRHLPDPAAQAEVYLVNPQVRGPATCLHAGAENRRFYVDVAFQLVFFRKGCTPGIKGSQVPTDHFSPPLACAPSHGECNAQLARMNLQPAFTPRKPVRRPVARKPVVPQQRISPEQAGAMQRLTLPNAYPQQPAQPVQRSVPAQ